jgi:hypothetical protein
MNMEKTRARLTKVACCIIILSISLLFSGCTKYDSTKQAAAQPTTAQPAGRSTATTSTSARPASAMPLSMQLSAGRSISAPPASECVRWPDAGGSGAVPYNFRIIDGKLLAGGNLFNPSTHANSAGKVHEYLRFLKKQGATSIVALHVPGGGSSELNTIAKFCAEEGMTFVKRRMNSEQTPNEAETKELLSLIDNGAYVHCMWGCDRTGAVIAKYLRVRKGFSGEQAWHAVISGGSHAGALGGLKKNPGYRNLILYFWPEVTCENSKVCALYGLPFAGSSAKHPL